MVKLFGKGTSSAPVSAEEKSTKGSAADPRAAASALVTEEQKKVRKPNDSSDEDSSEDDSSSESESSSSESDDDKTANAKPKASPSADTKGGADPTRKRSLFSLTTDNSATLPPKKPEASPENGSKAKKKKKKIRISDYTSKVAFSVSFRGQSSKGSLVELVVIYSAVSLLRRNSFRSLMRMALDRSTFRSSARW